MVGEALPPSSQREAVRREGRDHDLHLRPVAARSDVRLRLPAEAENVAVVRHVLGALGDVLELPDAVVNDIRLAVTEACTNVVRHAYVDRPGIMEVVVRPYDEALEVAVADTGRGMGPSPDTRGPGLGLPLIAALADGVTVEPAPISGSRVVMRFRRERPSAGMGPA
jgi:anti-sigma regulatory factor (Ser/Thr protein kinase)